MWVLYAFGSALFAGLTAVLAKCGIRKTDSTVATAIRTIVVLIFSWVMVFLVGSQGQIAEIGGKTLLFLILSGLATGASWLCYFRALQDGPASVVAPIDKLSILVTILFSWLVFHEKLTKKGRHRSGLCRRRNAFEAVITPRPRPRFGRGIFVLPVRTQEIRGGRSASASPRRPSPQETGKSG